MARLRSNGGVDVPNYLIQGKGWYAPSSGSGCRNAQVYLPDWNDPVVLNAVTALLNALGAKYDSDPRVNFIDIGIMGDWGEWHLAEFPYCDSNHNTSLAALPTTTTLQAIINAHVAAFPNKQLLMLTDDAASTLYALKLPTSIPIGLRRDSWGAAKFNSTSLIIAATTSTSITAGGTCTNTYTTVSAADQATIFNRWMTAPFVAESYGGASALAVGTTGVVEQIQSCHIAAINNGSWSMTWASLTAASQTAFLTSGAASGFRLGVTNINISQADANHITIASTWTNTGNSVPYDHWSVQFILYDSVHQISVASTVSALNPQSVLPASSFGTCLAPLPTSASAASPLTVNDLFAINAVAAGTYDVRVKIIDVNGYLAPMNLAFLATANLDGSYSLGSITLQ